MEKEMFDFERCLRGEGKAKRTIQEYCRRVRLWYRYLVRRKEVLDIMKATRQDILDYRGSLLALGQSVRTVNVKISSISKYYECAILCGFLKTNPVPRGLYIKAPAPNTKRLSDEELIQVEHWMDSLRENVRAAFWCMYGTGARVGEIAKLRGYDVFLLNGVVYIEIKGAKWGSDRTIPIMHRKAAQVVYKFAQHQLASNQPLFRLSKRTIQVYATTFAEATGMNFHCHVLRHTFATRLVERGVPLTKVQFLLGHRTSAMTAHYTKNAHMGMEGYAPRIFLHPDEENKEKENEDEDDQ